MSKTKPEVLERTPDIELAIAQMESFHPGKSTYIDPNRDQYGCIKRWELSLPSFNKILSNRYSGEGAGFPAGKVINIYGPESIGKTALAAAIVGEILHQGGSALWIDGEGSVDRDYMLSTYGIDVEDGKHFVLQVVENAEEAFDSIQAFIDIQAVDIIVLDSVPSLGTAAQNDKSAEKASMAETARKLSEHFPKIISKLGKTSIIYINQLRENITNMGAYGKKFTGGNAMKFYPHIGLEMKRLQKSLITKGNGDTAEFLGQQVYVRAKKNKTSRPYLWTYLTFFPEEGFSRIVDILELAQKTGVVKKSGAWYQFGERTIGQGIDKTRLLLEEDEELLEDIWIKTQSELDPTINQITGEILDEKI